MLKLISKCWWIFALRGLVAVLFGLTAVFFWPLLEVGLFVLFFGCFAFFEGLLSIIASLSKPDVDYWWVILLEGFIGALLGLVIFFSSSITKEALLVFIAVWGLTTGILQIAVAVRLRKEIRGAPVLGLTAVFSGVVSILFGLIVMFHPGKGAPSIFWVVGVYTTIFGILLIIKSLQASKLARP